MTMERRKPQNLARGQYSEPRFNAGKTRTTPKVDYKLELQTNSWLRISLAAKDSEIKFTNLFCHFTVENLREAFHALDGSKATGISGITKRDYGKSLDKNLSELVDKLHQGTYRPKPKKGIQIPKADGKTRPIAISEFEDKLVEWVLAKTLSSVYERVFINNSFGFRFKRSAHDAIKATYKCIKDTKTPYVVEIDLRSFFNTVSHRKLMRLIGLKITDPRIHSLISRFLKAGIINEKGELENGEIGTPQGSIMSPVLANVFLHYCLDEWFVKNHASKGGYIVRYADDAVFVFDQKEKAEIFKEALMARLKKYSLTLNEDKSGIIEFGKRHGNVFEFLGFTFFWSKDHNAKRSSLRVKTSRKTLFKKIQDFKEWIKENRNRKKLDDLWSLSAAKLRGHYQYYGVHTNRPKLNHFYFAVVASLFKWLNRRSQRKSFTWERFAKRLLHNPLPTPPMATSMTSLEERWAYAR